MKKALLICGPACLFLLAACALPEIDTSLEGASKKAQRPTGSNISRMTRDPDLEGWRQGYGRDEMGKIQLGRPLVGEGGNGAKSGTKSAWYR